MADEQFTISDLTELTAAGISSKGDVWLGVDNLQGGTPISQKISVEQLEDAIGGGGGGGGGVEPSNTFTATAHGFTAADVGKPLGYTSAPALVVWDDTTTASYPFGLLMSVIDANTLEIARCGEIVEVADALLPGTVPNDAANSEPNSRLLYWDASAVAYVFTLPEDSIYELECVIYLKASPTASKSLVVSMLPRAAATKLES